MMMLKKQKRQRKGIMPSEDLLKRLEFLKELLATERSFDDLQPTIKKRAKELVCLMKSPAVKSEDTKSKVSSTQEEINKLNADGKRPHPKDDIGINQKPRLPIIKNSGKLIIQFN
jgi:hypothetical protein